MKNILLKLFGIRKIKAAKYWKESLDLYCLGKYAEGVSLCEKAIRANPKDYRAYKYRGFGYSELKEYSKAISDYTKAIELNKDDETIYSDRAKIYANNLKEYSKAIADYTKVIELDPEHIRAYYKRGELYYDLKDFRNAILDFTKIIEMKPNFELAYIRRGEAYISIDDFSNSISDYSKAIDINIYGAETYLNRALAYSAIGEDNKGNIDFQKATHFAYRGENHKIGKYEIIEIFFDDLNEYWRFFMNKNEISKETPGGKCTATLKKEEDGKWLYTLSWWEDGKWVGEHVRPFRANQNNLDLFNKGCAETARRLRIFQETNDFNKVPQKPPAFGKLSCDSPEEPEPIRERKPDGKYFPVIKNAKLVKRFNVGIYEMVLYTDVIALGIIQYSHILFAYINGQKEPSFAVASEFDNLDEPDSIYRFLGSFSSDRHINYGKSEEWADLTLFEKKAYEIMNKELGVEIV